MRIVGVIPARAGSKRLPNKNLLPLRGRPLIAHTCDAARACPQLDAVYVNTDCPQIAAVAARHGVAAPFLRPTRLATDTAETRAANRFFLEVLRERGETYDAICVLQPTSPLRSAEDISSAIELFIENAPCAVVSVSEIAPASWIGRLGRDGRFEPGQGSEPLYRLNGAIYLYTVADYLRDREPPRTLALPLPSARGVDIDTIEDLLHAETLLSRGGAVAGV